MLVTDVLVVPSLFWEVQPPTVTPCTMSETPSERAMRALLRTSASCRALRQPRFATLAWSILSLWVGGIKCHQVVRDQTVGL